MQPVIFSPPPECQPRHLYQRDGVIRIILATNFANLAETRLFKNFTWCVPETPNDPVSDSNAFRYGAQPGNVDLQPSPAVYT